MLFVCPYIMVMKSFKKFSGNSGVLEDIGCCSSTGDRNYDQEEQNHGIEITNQPEVDGEIDRQQNEMNAVTVSILFLPDYMLNILQ